MISHLASASSTAVAAGDIKLPSISYSALSPILVIFGVACLGVLLEGFLPPRLRPQVQPVVAVLGFAAALGCVVSLAGTHELTAADAVAIDGPALFIEGTLVLFGMVSVLMFAERKADPDGGALVADAASLPGQGTHRLAARNSQTEAYPLMVFAVAGMMLFAAADNLLVMFVALEILSLPLYLLSGLARRRRLLSQEAALKYFLLGAFSSAFFLYGIAMLYGYSGTVSLQGIAVSSGLLGKTDFFLYLGLGLLGIGLLFKIGAVPFHAWMPDVYQGAPTPVTAFMSAATKIAAFGALLRVLYVSFAPTQWDWRPVVWLFAILTMVVGAIVAITQRDVKRLLAYSTIAHSGFILVGVAAATQNGISSSIFYLLAYGFTSLGAFAVVMLVRSGDGEANDLGQWQGLARRSPVLAGTFAFLLFALAGIPLTSGFTGKFVVFSAAIGGNATFLVVVALVTSAIAAFFYVKIVVLMFFQEPRAEGPVVVRGSVLTYAAVGVGIAVTLMLGIYPQPVLDLAREAAQFGFVS